MAPTATGKLPIALRRWSPDPPARSGSTTVGTADRDETRSAFVDVRIGIIQTPRELDVELADGADRDQVIADVEKALSEPEGVLWLTDKRGRRVGVPSSRIAYVEVAASDERRVGFGAPKE
jgi:hypothetical protein